MHDLITVTGRMSLFVDNFFIRLWQTLIGGYRNAYTRDDNVIRQEGIAEGESQVFGDSFG